MEKLRKANWDDYSAVVLYHDDADGFGAAYAAWRALGFAGVRYVAVNYGQAVPELPPLVEGLPTRVVIVDFSYPREELEALAERIGEENLVVLDHHKTAEADLKGLPYAFFDLEKSGARLAWEYFHPQEKLPDILAYVEDRDLWRFRLDKSDQVNMYISTLARNFGEWDRFDLKSAMEAGYSIHSYRRGLLEQAMKYACLGYFAGHRAVMLNSSTLASELGHQLLVEYPEALLAVIWWYDLTAERREGEVQYSLRSRGDFDVGALAKQLGGGGHKAAAGLRLAARLPGLIAMDEPPELKVES